MKRKITEVERLSRRSLKRDKFYKLKSNIHDLRCKLRFLFQPFFTIGFCIFCMIVLNTVLIIPMICLCQYDEIYNILFALITGVTASFGVSVCIECSNNYRYNIRKSLELAEYYSVFWVYELEKGIGMKKREFFENEYMDEEFEESLDDIQVLWKELPELMPMFQKTIEEKKEFLSYKELETLDSILMTFGQMKRYISTYLLPDVIEAKIMDKDLEFLNNWIPANLKKVLSDEYLQELSRLEFDQAFKAVVDKIFTNTRIMEVALEEDIPVGRRFLEEGEEEYSDSYMMSLLLRSMLDEIEVLEQEALKQPVAGYLIKDMKRKQHLGK